MSRKFLVVVTIVGFVVISVISLFVYRNFSGAGPAILPPKPVTLSPPSDKALQPGTPEQNLLGLSLPAGFSISIFADNLVNTRGLLVNPRVLSWDPDLAFTGGTKRELFLSAPSQGQIAVLVDELEGNVWVKKPLQILENLDRPHGFTFRCEETTEIDYQCWLYVAETDKVVRYDYKTYHRDAKNGHVVFRMPGGGNHFTRTIQFGPDGRLYVSIGSSCNVCLEKDERRAAIYSMNKDGSDVRLFARGLRNSVFFTWHPRTGKMWATEMGRDLLGDDSPPDEINIVEEGKDYGWPNCFGKNVVDPFGNDANRCRNTTPSHIDLPAHSAPLGLTFIPENSAWPKEYWGDLLVAYHGSWNRSVPTGYKVVRVKLDEQGNSEGIEDFITGWLTENGEATGRPVDLLFAPDGTLFISDDKAGVIYRVQWQGTP